MLPLNLPERVPRAVVADGVERHVNKEARNRKRSRDRKPSFGGGEIHGESLFVKILFCSAPKARRVGFILTEIIAAAIALGITIGFLRDLLKPEKPPKSPEKRLGEALGEVLERYRDRQ